MSWLELILSTLGGSLAGLIGGIAYFRPRLKQARADAAMKETESHNFMYESLVNRINSMETMYNEQTGVIENLRSEVLTLSKEKFDNAKRILQLETENKELTKKMAQLEKEVQAYKTIAHK